MRRKTAIATAVVVSLLSGCAVTTIGKLDLSTGQLPPFLKVGQTTQQDVLMQLGEPLGYREHDDRSVMSYEYVRDQYVWLVLGSYWQQRAYRMYVVFDHNVLSKAEIRRDGWGFAGGVDPQLVQLLIR